MNPLWTVIPFLLFFSSIVFYEVRHRRREKKRAAATQRFLEPLAATANRMYEKTYGRASTSITKTFPGLRQAK